MRHNGKIPLDQISVLWYYIGSQPQLLQQSHIGAESPRSSDVHSEIVDDIKENCFLESSRVKFKNLLSELELKHNELCLPLEQFLAGSWYRRVKNHLLTRQDPEEQHIAGATVVGVELEYCGFFVLD
jgi:hypothetical protein